MRFTIAIIIRERQRHWRFRVEEALKTYEDVGVKFEIIAEERLVGMYVVAFVQSALRTNVKRVETSHVGCGLMGTLGNKGAVAVRFNYFESTFCFVACHLAAHQVKR